MALVFRGVHKFPEIEKNWLSLFYPVPKGSQQKPIFFEIPFRGFRGKKGKFVVHPFLVYLLNLK